METCRNTTGLAGHVIRPAYFFPQLAADRMNQRTCVNRVWDNVLSPVLSLFRVEALVSPLNELGVFPLEVAKGRWPDEELFLNKRMRELMRTV